MSYKFCRQKIGEAFPDADSKTLKQAAEIMSEAREGGASLAEAMAEASEFIEGVLLEQNEVKYARKLAELHAVKNVYENIEMNIARQSPEKTLKRVTADVQHRISTITARLQRIISTGMDARDIVQSRKIKTHAFDMAHEMSNLEANPTATSGVTQNHLAFKQAKVYRAVLNQIVEMQSSYRHGIKLADEYFWRSTHDRRKIRAMGFDKWYEFTVQHFDDKSFPGVKDENRIVAYRATYNSIIAGKYSGRIQEANGLPMGRVDERVLIPNNADSFAVYSQRLGRGDVHDVMVESIQNAARDIAVMATFTDNPNAVFQHIVNKVNKKSTEDNRVGSPGTELEFAL